MAAECIEALVRGPETITGLEPSEREREESRVRARAGAHLVAEAFESLRRLSGG